MSKQPTLTTWMHILRAGSPIIEARQVTFTIPKDNPKEVYADERRGPGYPQLRALIEPILAEARPGANLEHVSVLWKGKKADMFVDDEGRLHGLPRNAEATDIYRANWLAQHPDTDPESLPFIAGTAVVFSDEVWF